MKFQASIQLRTDRNALATAKSVSLIADSNEEARAAADQFFSIFIERYHPGAEVVSKKLIDITEHDVHPYCNCDLGDDCPGPGLVDWA